MRRVNELANRVLIAQYQLNEAPIVRVSAPRMPIAHSLRLRAVTTVYLQRRIRIGQEPLQNHFLRAASQAV